MSSALENSILANRSQKNTQSKALDLLESVKLALKEFLKGAVRGFAISLTFKAILNTLFGLLKGIKSIQVSTIINSDALSLAKFLALYVGLIRSSLVLLSNAPVSKRAKFYFIALLSSLAIKLDTYDRRKEIAVYLFFRGLYIQGSHLVRIGVLPRIPHFQKLLFGIVNLPIAQGMVYEPDILDSGYYKWILKTGDMTHDRMEQTLRYNRKLWLESGTTSELHYHDGPCLRHCTGHWVTGVGNASKMYAIVHLLPILLFKYKKILSQPLSLIWPYAVNVLRSSLFLSSYTFSIESNICSWRALLGYDSWIVPVAGAMGTSLACFFEKSSRITELLLYCCPRSAEAAYRYLVKHGCLRYEGGSNHFVALFGVANLILLTSAKEDFKPAYFQALKFLIG